jgi:acetylornithine/N-succinyldiaminopimelate aminotransferase
LETLIADNLLSKTTEDGQYLMQRLLALKEKHSIIEIVRGKGLLIGVQLSIPGAPVVNACREKGYLINCIQDNVLRLAPPLVIRRDQIDGLIQCLDDIFDSANQKNKGPMMPKSVFC